MAKKVSRRDFVKTSAVTGLVAATPGLLSGKSPTVYVPSAVKPVMISSANGNKYKNGGNKTGIEIGFAKLASGDDVLDSVIACVNIPELDPLDDSVGYGGLPNADGVVQLDSCCMHGPKKQAGGVASLEGVRTPSIVAKAVMENTDHHLLVGKGAQGFARDVGFKIEDDLNTPHSRELWLDWKRRIDPEHYLDPKKREEASMRATMQMVAEGLIDPHHVYGTINCDGINSKGEICGVTTTSGLAWKIPGRVGDSPILGAGLYVDNEVGAAGSTGRGEANLYNLSSFYIVENMRRGMHPKDACIDALKRIKAGTVEKRLLDEKGQPNFHLVFYALNKKGEYAGVSMFENIKYAVCDENGPRTVACEFLLPGKPLH
jgi:N4-(beta-N-acetylglucosaminyl)-L-asparaginase